MKNKLLPIFSLAIIGSADCALGNNKIPSEFYNPFDELLMASVREPTAPHPKPKAKAKSALTVSPENASTNMKGKRKRHKSAEPQGLAPALPSIVVRSPILMPYPVPAQEETIHTTTPSGEAAPTSEKQATSSVQPEAAPAVQRSSERSTRSRKERFRYVPKHDAHAAPAEVTEPPTTTTSSFFSSFTAAMPRREKASSVRQSAARSRGSHSVQWSQPAPQQFYQSYHPHAQGYAGYKDPFYQRSKTNEPCGGWRAALRPGDCPTNRERRFHSNRSTTSVAVNKSEHFEPRATPPIKGLPPRRNQIPLTQQIMLQRQLQRFKREIRQSLERVSETIEVTRKSDSDVMIGVIRDIDVLKVITEGLKLSIERLERTIFRLGGH